MNTKGTHWCCSAHGAVHAIVRAKSDEEAAARLRAGYDSGSAELLQTFDALSRDHLVVHTGALLLSRAVSACLAAHRRFGLPAVKISACGPLQGASVACPERLVQQACTAAHGGEAGLLRG